MSRKYIHIMKTGDSELRAVSKLKDEDLDNIFSIIELTRGRRSKVDTEGKIEKRLEKLLLYSNKSFILDLTSEPALSNSAIDELFIPDYGYKNWVDFLKKMRIDFPKLIPTILIVWEEGGKRVENINKQISNLSEFFEKMALRIPVNDHEIISLVKEIVKSNNKIKFELIFDVPDLTQNNLEDILKESKFLTDISQEAFDNCNLNFIANSFPKTVPVQKGPYGDVTNSILELDYASRLKEHADSKRIKIQTGDYSSISHIRNDEVVMSRGWIPRIDFPFQNEIISYFSRTDLKNGEGYTHHYQLIASKIVKSEYFNSLPECWGKEMIQLTSQGASPGASPAFWISVRMNLYISSQLKKLK